MSRASRIPTLGGATALILHRPHANVQAITRQLEAIGLIVRDCWPTLPAEALAADFVFFDVDLGFDEQFPWKSGEAPMPTVALIGSEAPGRIEWALSQRADAQLMKPVGQSGVYSALLIARQAFDARRQLASEVEALKSRIGERQTIVRAVACLSERGLSDADAYGRLRALAMSWQVNIEEAARKVLSARTTEGDDERSGRA